MSIALSTIKNIQISRRSRKYLKLSDCRFLFIGICLVIVSWLLVFDVKNASAAPFDPQNFMTLFLHKEDSDVNAAIAML